ncbi:hypothetical protein HK098_007640 [Nowakowskiella sp. JEL0407]|nr:hypothetical protein HK098_007640 [Nowakowskiella sp. JEL0407]
MKDSIKSSLDVVFLLDVTGSMSGQIQAMKQMIKKFSETDRPGISIRIFTFGESTQGCYVEKSPKDANSSQLIQWVDNIKLGICDGGNAGGGDGPENQAAALYSLLDEYTTDQNILCFLITDAYPHIISNGQSQEAQREIEWLRAHNSPSTDLFVVLNLVIESLNVTIVPILYYSSQNAVWYQQAAILTDGVILVPRSTDSATLSSGLVSVMEALQQVSINRSISLESSQALSGASSGFSIVRLPDEGDFTPLEEDSRDHAIVYIVRDTTSQPEEIKEAFLGLLQTTCDRFAGKKGGKRCRTISNPNIITASVKVLIYSMLYMTGSTVDTEGVELRRAISFLEEQLTGDEDKFAKTLLTSWSEKIFEKKNCLADDIKSVGVTEVQPVSCAITLESATEYLNGLEELPRTEEEISAWMEIALQLVMCRLVDVSFPLDILGKPDFADAWSSSIKNISLSTVLSASAAVHLRDKTDNMYLDPMTRNSFSTAVIMAHPNDKVLTTIFRVLSVLPTLQGLIQGYLVSGGLRIFPSLVPGLLSSCLVYFLRSIGAESEFTPAQYEIVRCIIWSLRNTLGSVAKDAVKAIKETGDLNPADPLSKLVAAIIFYIHRSNGVGLNKKLMMNLYEELVGESIQFVMRIRMKRAMEARESGSAEKEYKLYELDMGLPNVRAIVNCVVPEDGLEFNPVESIHPAEQIANGSLAISTAMKKKLLALVECCPAFERSLVRFDLLNKLLVVPLDEPDFAKAVSRIDVSTLPEFTKDELSKAFLESLILEKRTGRYDLVDETKTWKKKRMIDVDGPLRETVTSFYAKKSTGWRAARTAYAQSILIDRFVSTRGKIMEECDAKMKEISYDLHGQTYKLARIDSVRVLDKLWNTVQSSTERKEVLETLGLALIFGTTWTTSPTSELKRSTTTILGYFEELGEDVILNLKKALNARALCMRETPNRHGHTKANQYPGFAGWTQEYEDSRLAASGGSEKVKKILSVMKSFALWRTKVFGEMDTLVAEAKITSKQADLFRWIINAVDGSHYGDEVEHLYAKFLSAKKMTMTDVEIEELLKSNKNIFSIVKRVRAAL